MTISGDRRLCLTYLPVGIDEGAESTGRSLIIKYYFPLSNYELLARYFIEPGYLNIYHLNRHIVFLRKEKIIDKEKRAFSSHAYF